LEEIQFTGGCQEDNLKEKHQDFLTYLQYTSIFIVINSTFGALSSKLTINSILLLWKHTPKCKTFRLQNVVGCLSDSSNRRPGQNCKYCH